jgi:hypothetical protein
MLYCGGSEEWEHAGGALNKHVYLASACIALCIWPRYVAAQSPPAFDPKAMQAAMEAFDKVPDTTGTGKYPALKEESPALPNHVIYRPADLSKLGDAKLGVLAWGNGGCAADGAGARLHLAEIASHGYLAIANGKILSGPGAAPRPKPPAIPPGSPPPGRPGFHPPPPATSAAGLREAID